MILYLFILAINFSVLLSVTEEQREAIESITKDVNKAPDFTLYSIESKDYSWVKSILIEMTKKSFGHVGVINKKKELIGWKNLKE